MKKNNKNSSKEGDVILDCFLGPGTTAACTKKLNRTYIGFELNQEFAERTIERINLIN